MNRIERWRSGEKAALWYKAASMKQSKNKSNSTIESLASRAKTLCPQGQFGRAEKILSSKGIAPDSKKTLIELKKLHPEENEILEPMEDYSCEAYQFYEGKVFLQLQSFSNFTSAGPSKMYPEHRLHAINCSISRQSKRAMNSQSKFVNLARRGLLPSFVAPAFRSATLTALKKRKLALDLLLWVKFFGALLPSALQKKQPSRRLSCLVQSNMELLSGELNDTKKNLQRMKRVKSGGILQIDFRNAFNSVKRSRFLGPTKVLMPSIMSSAFFCYSKHSDLFFNSSTVDSQTGVQQGDPPGPNLFSLVIWPLIDEIESKLPNLSKHCCYLDDEIIAGIDIELCKALEILSESREKFGLELKKDKCKLWSIKCMTKVDSLIKRNWVDGIEVLGAAIRFDAFVSSCLLKRVKKLDELLDNLACVDDSQCALGILRFCYSFFAKMVYSLRYNSPSDESIKSFGNLIRFSVQHLKVFLDFCCQTAFGTKHAFQSIKPV